MTESSQYFSKTEEMRNNNFKFKGFGLLQNCAALLVGRFLTSHCLHSEWMSEPERTARTTTQKSHPSRSVSQLHSCENLKNFIYQTLSSKKNHVTAAISRKKVLRMWNVNIPRNERFEVTTAVLFKVEIFLQCSAVLLGKHFLIFQMNALPWRWRHTTLDSVANYTSTDTAAQSRRN